MDKLKKFSIYSIVVIIVIILAARAGGKKESTKVVVPQWHKDRIIVAAGQVNKYSPYTCNRVLEESFVSSWDNHTVNLICDNWNRFEVKTVAGHVIVEHKG